MSDGDKKVLQAYAEFLFNSDIFKIDREFPVPQIYVNLDFRKEVKPLKQSPIERPEPMVMDLERARRHGQPLPSEPKVVSIDEILKVPMGLVIGKPGAGKTTTLKFLAVQHLIALIRRF
ncbi:MAG: hypothetical protein DRQ10_00675 [Candidatus Hydrothermota bacterium]|nr:MAG: hypothetical protein DRQ10_00675 [Candidatus Hydrothermae bacterium]